MAVDYKQIGQSNQQIVLALKNGWTHIGDDPIEDFRHSTAYNYDLSYGLHAIYNKTMLKGTYVGVKYYCCDKYWEWDMAKRIVHVYDRLNPASPQSFYRLIHTPGAPEARDNSYNQCDLITNIP
ncbi:MAG TPA: hypothetical protein VL346_12110 [Acidobacteriaceae bacterium]|nr:hypothetical protein [Acidobacteriaceae bacterium]